MGMESVAGPRVTEESSLRSTAVFACVRILSESIASLPLMVYRRQGRYRHPAFDHPLFDLLYALPNPEQTSMEWRETSMVHLLLWGNAFSEIDWDDNGQVRSLWPLRPDRMHIYRDPMTDELIYYYYPPDSMTNDTRPYRLPAYRVHHIRTLSGDGVVGYSPIRVAAIQAIGLALATEEFGSRYFSNGARPGIILRHPGRLSEEAHDRLKNSWQDGAAGLANAHRTRIIEEGMDVSTVGVPPEEAQFLETRKYQTAEIARIYRVPLHLLNELDRATFNNVEHLSTEFVRFSLRPYFVRHEQAIGRDMMLREERRHYFAKYTADALLRGDTKTRHEAHGIAIQSGFKTRNEVREIEGLNPIDGGDTLLMPLNMIEVGADPPKTSGQRHAPQCTCGQCDGDDFDVRRGFDGGFILQETRSDQVADDRMALIRRSIGLFEDAAGRLVRREVADLHRAVKKYINSRSLAEFESWLATFYEDLRDAVPGYFEALMASLAEQVSADVASEMDEEDDGLTDDLRGFIDAYLVNYAANYTASGERQMLALIRDAGENEEEAEALINERLDGWADTKPGKEALSQAFEAANALAVAVYAGAGVMTLIWKARGDSCPFCQGMDGRRIPLDGSFVEPGGSVEGGEDDEPMKVRRKIRHGPLHGGCDCVVIAG